ncbi:SusC/RagA family TonB-linked outer membrane protein [Dysgonomonas sp. HGC4]|nr:SusC/RagA family TonB-linked outer membrane protein [Dysgonomonas sp. HGC4]MBD8347867.1 SusC/RagA family TonB-linked outer membrane protein [Dysgonomonas sp. HGC4]
MLLSIVQQVSAQSDQIKVSGIVLDETGQSIIGASVNTVGARQGTITDLDGRFTITSKNNAILQVSYIGYITQNINIGNKTDLRVVMKEDSKTLDEVVVTALGISRDAKSLPYARQSVDKEGLDEAKDPNLLNMLSGRVSGVQFISNGGALSSTRVVIRGENSLTGNNQPLYVIDGVPIMNNMGDSGDLDYGNAASSINPDDVESIEVLKGANASALYGSDAANGVILITTKKAGKKAGLGVTYSNNTQFSKLNQFPIYQNVYGAGTTGLNSDFNYQGQSGFNPDLPLQLPNLSLSGYGNRSFGLPMLGFNVIGRDGKVKTYSPSPETITNMYQVGTQMTNSLSLERVTDLVAVRLSYTNIHSDDILENFNKLNRNTFNLGSNIKLAKFLSADINAQYVKDKVDNRGFRNSSDRNPLYAITNLPRDASYEELKIWKNEDGTPKTQNSFYNPYWLINELSNADEKNWLMANLTLNFTLTNYLKLRLRGATDYQTMDAWSFTNFYSPFDRDGEYFAYQRQATNNMFEALVMFNKKVGKFNLNSNLGTSNQKVESKQLRSTVQSLLMPDVKSLSNNAATASTWEEYSGKEKIGLFLQANAGYNNFAYIDVTARNDWSSTLPYPHSYFYYSGGTSIILTEALKIPKDILSFAKVRSSYAKTGNDTGFDMLRNGFSYGGLFNGTMPWYTGDNISRNPNLKPETTISTEFGTDLRFFNDRLSIDFTYYQKATKDQIVQASVSAVSGYEKKMFNSGEIQNKGYELSINAIPVRTKNFEWSIRGNWSKNESKVISLMDGVDRFRLANWNGTSVEVFAEVGQPYGVMYGTDYKRNENGDVLCDINGRPKSDSESHFFGKVSPDWIGGINNSFRYRDFDMNFLIDFKQGGLLWSYSSYQGSRNGQTVESLQGRNEFILSSIILGENDSERKGYLEANRTNSTQNYNAQYLDKGRVNGSVLPDRRVYDAEVPGLAGQECTNGINPVNYYSDDVLKSARRYLYDASFVKLRAISVGYNVPRNFLRKSPFNSVRLSAVGRNIWTMHQNTPKGLDPEATTNTGNGQGIEQGFSLPQANYGFDIKVTF